MLIFSKVYSHIKQKRNTNWIVDNCYQCCDYCCLNFQTLIPGCHYFSHRYSLIVSLYFNFPTTDFKIPMFHVFLFLFWWVFSPQGRHFLFCSYVQHKVSKKTHKLEEKIKQWRLLKQKSRWFLNFTDYPKCDCFSVYI